MKKNKILTLLLVLLALASIAAAVDKTVGERINLLQAAPETSYDANTPFHIMHGWGWVYANTWNNSDYASYQAPGRGYISLELDGEGLKSDFLLRDVTLEYLPFYDLDVRWYDIFWVYNFPDGLEGDHTFMLTYYFPCEDAEIEFGYTGFVCEDKPNAVVPVITHEILVHYD